MDLWKILVIFTFVGSIVLKVRVDELEDRLEALEKLVIELVKSQNNVNKNHASYIAELYEKFGIDIRIKEK